MAEPEIPCWLDGAFLADLMKNKQYRTNLYDHMVPELIPVPKETSNLYRFRQMRKGNFVRNHGGYLLF